MYVLIPVYIRMCLMYVCISFIYVYMYVFMYVCMYVCMYVRNERLLISFRWSLNHPSKAVWPPPTRSGLSVTDKLYVCVCMYVCMCLCCRQSREFMHSLFCESPAGVLPARSRTRVVFTYHPVKAGLFEFLIFAQVRVREFIHSNVLHNTMCYGTG